MGREGTSRTDVSSLWPAAFEDWLVIAPSPHKRRAFYVRRPRSESTVAMYGISAVMGMSARTTSSSSRPATIFLQADNLACASWLAAHRSGHGSRV